MLRHDLAIAVRRIASRPSYSTLCAAVLALGILCFLAAYVFVSYLRSYDHNFANHARTYVISQSVQTAARQTPLFMNYSALPLADHLRADFPDLTAVARYSLRLMPVGVGPEATQRRVGYAEPAFFEIFDFTPIAGDLRGALSEPRSVVLTKDTAQSLFGTTQAVGKTLTLNGREGVEVTVRAVVAELPRTSHLARRGLFTMGPDLLVSWDLFDRLEKGQYYESWGNSTVSTYVLTPADGSVSRAELDRRLASLAERNAPAPAQGYTFALLARPTTEIATTQMQQAFQGYSGNTALRIDIFAALLVFAGTILVIACLNFVNLATAESSGRTLAIGTRKALGATSAQIARQDLLQTALVVAAAIVIALVALVPIGRALAAPYALALAVPWTASRLWAFLAALLMGVTLAAGLYPALLLARVRPAAALRAATGGSVPRRLRTVLVGLQFGTATLLAIFVIVAVQQGDTIREAALGRFADQYLGWFLAPQAGLSAATVATELASSPRVRGVTRSNIPPFAGVPALTEYARSADELAPRSSLQFNLVGYDYFPVMDVPLLAGRVFSEDRADDAVPRDAAEVKARQGKPIPIVLDRDGARALGWSNPGAAVGEILFQPGVPAAAQGVPQYEVIGVVESVTFNVQDQGNVGAVYLLNPPFANFVLVRFDKNDTTAVLADVDATFKKLAPDRAPPQKAFLDELFENAYWTFRLMNRVLMGLAAFAITIAGIGLFGLASYVTRARTREIGLRKTQGASPAQIVRLLLWDFSKPVVAANVLAWPLAYYLAERYIAVFSARMTLTLPPFAAALLGTLGLAVATVGARALRASRLRPTDALREN